MITKRALVSLHAAKQNWDKIEKAAKKKKKKLGQNKGGDSNNYNFQPLLSDIIQVHFCNRLSQNIPQGKAKKISSINIFRFSNRLLSRFGFRHGPGIVKCGAFLKKLTVESKSSLSNKPSAYMVD
jgi:hypothetical protein